MLACKSPMGGALANMLLLRGAAAPSRHECSASFLAWAASRPCLHAGREHVCVGRACQYQHSSQLSQLVFLFVGSVSPGVGRSTSVDGPQAASGLPAGQVSAAHVSGLLAMSFSKTSSSSSFGSLQQHSVVAVEQARQCSSFAPAASARLFPSLPGLACS